MPQQMPCTGLVAPAPETHVTLQCDSLKDTLQSLSCDILQIGVHQLSSQEAYNQLNTQPGCAGSELSPTGPFNQDRVAGSSLVARMASDLIELGKPWTCA
jgi:hypothetical protein